MGLRYLQHGISTNVKPIELGEFIIALANVLKFPSTHHEHDYGRGNGAHGRKIGLAISGGVDSMALALLCSQLQSISSDQISRISKSAQDSLKNFRGISFQAFVVDHGARTGSHEEAMSVSAVLRTQGIQAHVRQISWPKTSLIDSSSFESLARKYRFRTLGEACQEYRLNALLLAHHEDDQAETVFMRLATGHRTLGLTGIKGDSEIPECYGLHGIHESGGIDCPTGPSKVVSQTIPGAGMNSLKRRAQLPIEHGGVRVYRPLLTFNKARLRATCETAKMEWFEDHTNKDPTLTMRNAVRHMYNSHIMPRALAKPAILELSQRCKEKAASRLATTNAWLAKCSISRFETRSGVLAIQFPELGLLDNTATSASERGQIAAKLLRRIIMLVTPEEHVDLASLDKAVHRIFPSLIQDKVHREETIKMTGSRTVAGVLFQPQPHSPRSWLLSRQPHFSSLSKNPLQTYQVQKDKAAWSPWQLYDGRFWIRIRNSMESSVTLCHFQKQHLKAFSKSLDVLDRARLQADLKFLAPGHIRWTLPALVSEKQGVLVLPTLDIKVPGCEIEWEVRYKKVDLEGLPLVGEML